MLVLTGTAASPVSGTIDKAHFGNPGLPRVPPARRDETVDNEAISDQLPGGGGAALHERC
jgi:hypothetical protein